MNRGPLFCPNCGLPIVPFGGEDICTGECDPDRDPDRTPDEDLDEPTMPAA